MNVDIDSAKLKLKAKKGLNKNFKPLVIATAVLMVLEAMCYFMCYLMEKGWLGSLFMLVIEALLLPGYVKMALSVSRNKKVKLDDLFSETESFFKYIGLTLIVGVIVCILCLLAIIDFHSLISIIFYQAEISKALAIFLIAFGLLLAVSIVLITIYVTISFSQVLFILVDRKDFSIRKILAESFDMMETFMLEYFILVLSFIGWMILGILTSGLLFIWVIPYMLVTLACFYDVVKKDYEDYLKEQDKQQMKEEKVKEAIETKSTTKKTTAKKVATKKTTTAKKTTTKKTTTAKKTTATKKAAPTKKTTTKKATAKKETK